MSGVDIDGRRLRKGATDAIVKFVQEQGGADPAGLHRALPIGSRGPAARRSRSPTGARLLGVIHLKDIVKGGMKERIAQLRAMGIRSVMVTGDNPLTAAAIAAEAGVDDFLAQATPKDKLEYIRKEQAGRPHGRHDRRRHQRRSRARPGRRRPGHEHRHDGRARKPATWWISTATRPS